MDNRASDVKTYDLVVAGGGFAGCCAAIAAARTGKKVLLTERYNALGGAPVFDLVNPFMSFFTRKDGVMTVLSRGIFSEILEEMRAIGGMGPREWHVFNEEYLKLVLNRMVLRSGAEILFDTELIGATQKDGKIEKIELSNVSGRFFVSAGYFVDATGDANLAFLGGFPYSVGRESDGRCQPMTLCFRMAGVNRALFTEQRPLINPLYKKLQAEGKITNPREDVLIFSTVMDSVLHFNTTRIVKLDPTDGFQVSKAEILAREQVLETVNFLKENFSCFADAQLISTGIRIGARESRMIRGLHRLTAKEIMDLTKFSDGIAACNYDIDIHSPDGSGTSHYYFPAGEYYTIPYGCLVPEGSKNLLAAGRCISASHEAQASIRIMPTCATLGEAAGEAAALAIESGLPVSEIDTETLRERLRKNGALVD